VIVADVIVADVVVTDAAVADAVVADVVVADVVVADAVLPGAAPCSGPAARASMLTPNTARASICESLFKHPRIRDFLGGEGAQGDLRRGQSAAASSTRTPLHLLYTWLAPAPKRAALVVALLSSPDLHLIYI
jgi:hypothetical protein